MSTPGQTQGPAGAPRHSREAASIPVVSPRFSCASLQPLSGTRLSSLGLIPARITAEPCPSTAPARLVRATHRSASGPGFWVRAAAVQSRASPEQRSAGRLLLANRKFPGASRGPAGSSGESQPALRAPASSLSLGRPRAPAPRREGGGILNKVPSPGPGGRGRSLVTRCPRHTPAASAEGRAGSARGWGWEEGVARLRIALVFLPCTVPA